jgi:type I restriction enzyme S subunit
MLARGFNDGSCMWEAVPANRIFQLQYGKALVEKNRKPGKIPVYGTNGQCGWHDVPLFRGPGVILGRKGQGPLGVEWCAGDYWVIDTGYTLELLTEKVDLKYAYNLIKFVGLNHLKDGTSNPTLSRDSFGSQEFPIPPMATQREIVRILDAIDDKIAILQENSATLEAIAQALFKSWFVDFDPVRAKAEGHDPEGMPPEVADLFPSEFVDSDLGLIPKGWRTQAVYDLAEFVNGASYKAFDPNPDRRGLPIIKIAELKAGVTTQTAYSDRGMPEKYLIHDRDILFSWSGNPETSIDTFVWSRGLGWLNQHIFKVIAKEGEDQSFTLLALKYFKPEFTRIAGNKQTTGLGHVTVADLKRLRLVKPPPSLLLAWNDLVAPLLDRVFRNELQANGLMDIRGTLLPRLMSGKLRIPDVEEVTV